MKKKDKDAILLTAISIPLFIVGTVVVGGGVVWVGGWLLDPNPNPKIGLIVAAVIFGGMFLFFAFLFIPVIFAKKKKPDGD